jgi:hypothetical protein
VSFFRAALLLLAAVVAIGCGDAPADEETEAAGSAIAWSESRFSFRKPTRGAIDLGNAYWLARLSQIAYLPPDQLQAALDFVGATGELAFFENGLTDTQAFYLGTPDAGIVVFRGTEGKKVTDLATDLKRSQTLTAYGSIHSGFLAAFESVWKARQPGLSIGGVARAGQGLEEFLFDRHTSRPGSRPLVFTGHSLGGALATIAYVQATYGPCLRAGATFPRVTESCFERANLDLESVRIDAVVTFGAPRAGDLVFATLAGSAGAVPDRARIVSRFVNGDDVVTGVPYFGYWHPLRDGSENQTRVDLGFRLGLPRLTVHGVADYIDQLRWIVNARKPADLPDPEMPDETRRRRFVQAFLHETTPLSFELIAKSALAGPPARLFARWEKAGVRPAAGLFVVDGESVVAVWIGASTSERVHALYGADGSFVVSITRSFWTPDSNASVSTEEP